MPEPVYQELSNPSIPHIKQRADKLISTNVASVQQMVTGTEEYDLYSSLIKGIKGEKQIGRGEAAGIALTKTYNGILASNNYKDVALYIKRYHLKHVDTGHILMEALEKQIITELEGNTIWQNMLNKNRRLPETSFTDYLRKRSSK